MNAHNDTNANYTALRENAEQAFLTLMKTTLAEENKLARPEDKEILEVCIHFENEMKKLTKDRENSEDAIKESRKHLDALKKRTRTSREKKAELAPNETTDIRDIRELDINMQQKEESISKNEKIDKKNLTSYKKLKSQSIAARITDIALTSVDNFASAVHAAGNVTESIPYVGLFFSGLASLLDLKAQYIDKESGQYKTRLATPAVKILLIIAMVAVTASTGGIGLLVCSAISIGIGLTSKISIMQQANAKLDHSKKDLFKLEKEHEKLIDKIKKNEPLDKNNLLAIHEHILDLHKIEILEKKIDFEREKVGVLRDAATKANKNCAMHIWLAVGLAIGVVASIAAVVAFPPAILIPLVIGVSCVGTISGFMLLGNMEKKHPKAFAEIVGNSMRGAADVLFAGPRICINLVCSIIDKGLDSVYRPLIDFAADKNNNPITRGIVGLIGTTLAIPSIPIQFIAKTCKLITNIFFNCCSKLIASKENGGIVANFVSGSPTISSDKYKIISNDVKKIMNSYDELFKPTPRVKINITLDKKADLSHANLAESRRHPSFDSASRARLVSSSELTKNHAQVSQIFREASQVSQKYEEKVYEQKSSVQRSMNSR